MFNWMSKPARRLRRSRDGSVAIQIALLAVVMIGMSALGGLACVGFHLLETITAVGAFIHAKMASPPPRAVSTLQFLWLCYEFTQRIIGEIQGYGAQIFS
jgi:type IV secretory pathway VirB2 component (pilin)